MVDRTEKLPEPTDLGTQAANLLTLLGGTKTTTSPGDTGALQSTLGQLQGTDYEAMLKAIFQQAGGQIPGLQQALGNAVGARSGGNSAVQAALQKLLAQTSTGAMDQIAKLQSQNMQTQANIGGNIAQATKGTTERKGTDLGGGLANATKLVALLQGAKTLGVDKWVKDLAGTGSTTAPSAAMNTAVTNAFSAPTAPLSTAETPMFNLGGSFAQSAPDYVAPVGSDVAGVPQVTDPDFQYFDMTGFQQPYQQPQYIPSFEQAAPQLEFPLDTYDETYTYADGGIVRSPQGKAEGYADGGTVRAGGSRRSANPTIDITAPETLLAQAASDELRGQFGAQGSTVSTPLATLSAGDIANRVTSAGSLNQPIGGGSGNGTAGGFNTGPTLGGKAFNTAVGKAGALSNISGVFGGPTLGPIGGVLGMAGQLANAPDNEAALGVMGKAALNIAAPGLGSLAGFATDPSVKTGVNLVTALNPIGALWGATSALTGLISPGELAQNAYELSNPNQMMTPDQEATVKAEQAFTPARQSTGGGNSNYGSNYGGNTSAGGLSGGFQGGFGSGSVGGTGGGFGNGTSDGAGGYGGADNGYKSGGPISGPGTGTSDSIPARLSDGEFVMSADVVDALGEDFFNQLQQAFHTPVAQ